MYRDGAIEVTQHGEEARITIRADVLTPHEALTLADNLRLVASIGIALELQAAVSIVTRQAR